MPLQRYPDLKITPLTSAALDCSLEARKTKQDGKQGVSEQMKQTWSNTFKKECNSYAMAGRWLTLVIYV